MIARILTWPARTLLGLIINVGEAIDAASDLDLELDLDLEDGDLP